MLSSRHVGLQGGCVGVGCLVSDTPGAPHAPHGVACSWTAAMQGPCIRSEPPAGRSRVDSAACSCHTFRGRIMYDRITVVDSVRGPQARGGGAGRAFAIRIRARLLSLTRPPVRVRSPFGRAIAGQRLWGRGPATAARVGARLLFLVHLAPSPSPTCRELRDRRASVPAARIAAPPPAASIRDASRPMKPRTSAKRSDATWSTKRRSDFGFNHIILTNYSS